VRWLTVLAATAALMFLLLPARGEAAVPGLPASFVRVALGDGGGTVWSGRIPNRQVAWDRRASAVYLPPGFNLETRYRVVYLLHGLRGSPSSYYDGLHLATVADGLIRSRQSPPFIAVMPVAGQIVNPDADEWAGAWESYVVRDVVPWVDAHLPTIASPAGRTLAGLCAGGYGAIDIGLRNPGVFGTLESWEGYFAPVFRDGPFVHASAADLAAHDPSLLVRRDAASLRKDKVRFYVSVGGNHAQVLRVWSIDFAQELSSLDLTHTLWQLPAAQRGHFWSATLPSALVYAATGAGAAAPA
jgi:enterochelin esterase-like enzyme